MFKRKFVFSQSLVNDVIRNHLRQTSSSPSEFFTDRCRQYSGTDIPFRAVALVTVGLVRYLRFKVPRGGCT